MLQSLTGKTMTTYFIIANPVAGSGAGAKAIPQVEAILERHGVDFKLVQTEAPGHGAEIAQNAASDFDVIVALGGDGTANEVINGLVSAKHDGMGEAILGVVGAGRGNDFADAINIPDDLDLACATLLQEQSRIIDIGRVSGGEVPDGRYFGNCVGVGFDAIATIEVKKLPRLGGFFSFLIAVLRTIILYNQAPISTVSFDGQSITQSSLMISIMNGRRLGGGFIMAPDSEPDDGYFDICIAKQVTRRRVLTLLPHFLRGDQHTQKEIVTGRASSITITTDAGVLPAQTDGEIISEEGKRLVIELLPREMEVICGPLKGAQ
jgi:diacylglycerol kinase (ATP)